MQKQHIYSFQLYKFPMVKQVTHLNQSCTYHLQKLQKLLQICLLVFRIKEDENQEKSCHTFLVTLLIIPIIVLCFINVYQYAFCKMLFLPIFQYHFVISCHHNIVIISLIISFISPKGFYYKIICWNYK